MTALPGGIRAVTVFCVLQPQYIPSRPTPPDGEMFDGKRTFAFFFQSAP